MTTKKMPEHVSLTTMRGREFPVLEIEKWRPNPDKPGFLRYEGNINGRELADAVEWFLLHRGHARGFDYYGLAPQLEYDGVSENPLPRFTWIAVYSVTGTNEGDYLHVDLIGQPDGKRDTRLLAYMAKTFEGPQFSYKVCADLARFLQA